MYKRILTAAILVAYVLTTMIWPASAADTGYKTASIIVESFGNQYKEEVLQDNSGTVYAPITWLTRYGLMACAEEAGAFVFYHVGEEQVRTFAKRIFIDKTGAAAKCGCYVSGTQFVTYCTPQFSGTYTKNGVLYLPIAELLPLLNAKVEITADGILHITNNFVSVFSALYAIDLEVLCFDAEQDMIGSEFMSAAGMVVDTIFNFRFDRLDGLYNTGKMNDYKSLFKAYLVDDEVYLSAYDKEITPDEAYAEIARNAMGDIDDTLGNTTKIPQFVEYLLDSSEFPVIQSFADDISDFNDVLSEGTDVAEGVYKIVKYLDAYENQVEDHRNMLDAVYGGDYFSQANPACKAADEIGMLYSNDTSNRLMTATKVGLRDFVTNELPDLALTELYSIAPYKIAFSITKLAIPEAFEEFENAALLSYMDQAVHDACKVYRMRMKNLTMEQNSLNDLRLTAMMALVASRHAYNTFWDDYSKVEDINSALTLLYLSSDSVECESQEYYSDKQADLKTNIHKLNVVVVGSETSVTLPSALVGQWNLYSDDYQDDVIWMIQMQENGEAFVGLGFALSEFIDCYSGEWNAKPEQDGTYTITLKLNGGSWDGAYSDYTLVIKAIIDGNLLKMQRISGDSSVTIEYEQWYERDLEYYTWLERQKGEVTNRFSGVWEWSALTAVREEFAAYGPAGLTISFAGSSVTLTIVDVTYTYDSYRIMQVEGYPCLLFPDGTGFVQFNHDMIGPLIPAESNEDYTFCIDGNRYYGDFWSFMNVFMRQGSETSTAPINVSYEEWSTEWNGLPTEAIYYPNANVLHLWGEEGLLGMYYVYDSGKLEYIEILSLPWADNLPSDLIYTDHGFVIADNK